MAGRGHGVGMWVGIMLIILGGMGHSVHGAQDECTVELYDMIFNPTLSTTKTPYAIVEFFTSW